MNTNFGNTMRLGIGSYTYPWAVGTPGHMPRRPLSALDLLEKARQLDVSVVQICDNLPLDALTESQLREVEHCASEFGVSLELGVRGIALDLLRRSLELAIRLKSPILRVVIDVPQQQPQSSEVPNLLRPVLKEFEQANVCLALENHDRFTAREFKSIVAQLDSPCVGICLDTVNSFGALEGPETVVTELAPWVSSLHIKDFVIHRASHNLGFVIEGCPAGRGRLNIPWILDQLRQSNRHANPILEQWPAPEATLEATIAKENEWALQSIEYLRRLIPD
jgi:sugar phosphate isomerase/epimerase